jgi:hypothetical protein
MAMLSACSSRTSISNGFELHDLGGSNQAIIGNDGVGVTDVTAYSLQRPRILFETGDVGKSEEAKDPDRRVSCEYGYIDLEKKLVVRAERDSELADSIRAALRKNGEGFVSRSCVKK